MLMRFSLTHKILAMNADNASSNDTQMTELAAMDNAFDQDHRIRCFNHTIQLSAKTLLRPFNAGIKAANDGDNDDAGVAEEMALEDFDEEEDEDEEEDDSGIDWNAEDFDDGVDELEMLPAHERERVTAETATIRETVTKLRQLAFAIIHSTTIALPAWRLTCETLKLKRRLIPRDVVTRWNSTYDMMHFALNYREAIDSITADKTLKLRKYELFAEDWNIIQDLTHILKQYKAATIHFSKNSASIAAVIPAMDKLTDSLNITATKPHHIAIQAAMKLARAKMNRYFSLTDSSSAYRISMVLHPGMKLEYFRQHKWQDDWIEEAENLVREEYISSYELKETASTATKPVSLLVKC